MGRAGEVGDELGSAVTAARLARDLMRLCLLMDRRYPPYGKWLGSAFARTAAGPRLSPVLTAALAATDWHTRERHLAHAYEIVAHQHNDLHLTDRVAPTTGPYHSRPFKVLHADRFTAALLARLGDPVLKDMPPESRDRNQGLRTRGSGQGTQDIRRPSTARAAGAPPSATASSSRTTAAPISSASPVCRWLTTVRV